MNNEFAVEQVHVSLIRAYDTVIHEGKEQTVCAKDIKRDDFMGYTLFGDSYRIGTKPVLRIVYNRWKLTCHDS